MGFRFCFSQKVYVLVFLPCFSCHQSGFTPLHIACVYGHFELARLLIEAGAEIESKTKYGYTALHLAAQYGHKLIIELLLERGANPNALTNVSIDYRKKKPTILATFFKRLLVADQKSR